MRLFVLQLVLGEPVVEDYKKLILESTGESTGDNQVISNLLHLFPRSVACDACHLASQPTDRATSHPCGQLAIRGGAVHRPTATMTLVTRLAYSVELERRRSTMTMIFWSWFFSAIVLGA